MSAAESSKRAAAEARRLKLLSRGKDRLYKITQGSAEATPADRSLEFSTTERHADASEPAASGTDGSNSDVLDDRGPSRSQSLPQSHDQLQEDVTPRETEPSSMPDEPMSPPPNTLWGTPRAPTRTDTGNPHDTPFATFPEDRKTAGRWAKYADTKDNLSLAKSVQRQKLSWHQACDAAVQTTHLLRMLAALLLGILLRAAKTVIYTGQTVKSWQRFLIHLYDVPPIALLSVVQLSAIGVVAGQFRALPSCIPHQAYSRVSTSSQCQRKGLLAVAEKLAVAFVPSAVTVYRQYGLVRLLLRAIADGVCVFLLTCMLLTSV